MIETLPELPEIVAGCPIACLPCPRTEILIVGIVIGVWLSMVFITIKELRQRRNASNQPEEEIKEEDDDGGN